MMEFFNWVKEIYNKKTNDVPQLIGVAEFETDWKDRGKFIETTTAYTLYFRNSFSGKRSVKYIGKDRVSKNMQLNMEVSSDLWIHANILPDWVKLNKPGLNNGNVIKLVEKR